MNGLIRLAYRVLHQARSLYWRLIRPEVFGVKVIILDPDRRVLLVRHSYGHSDLFMLPGGGVGPNEDAASAAAREAEEETGIVIGRLALHGQFVDTSRGARNHISVYVGYANDTRLCIDKQEIIDARWFSINDLPSNVSTASRLRVDEVRDGRSPSSQQWR